MPRSKPRRIVSIVLACLAMACAPAAAEAPVHLFHAASSGQETLDQGEGGGNPFASSLIELLSSPAIDLAELPSALARLTHEKSRGFQAADVAILPPGSGWPLTPMTPGERRLALVLIVSDYAASGGAQSLPGAAHDAHRIAQAFTAAGFETELALDLDLPAMRARLADFARRSATLEAAAIYTTGHGVEHRRHVYLIPGNYPIKDGNAGLATKALSLAEIARAPRARNANLVFYGGCRNSPFGD